MHCMHSEVRLGPRSPASVRRRRCQPTGDESRPEGDSAWTGFSRRREAAEMLGVSSNTVCAGFVTGRLTGAWLSPRRPRESSLSSVAALIAGAPPPRIDDVARHDREVSQLAGIPQPIENPSDDATEHSRASGASSASTSRPSRRGRRVRRDRPSTIRPQSSTASPIDRESHSAACSRARDVGEPPDLGTHGAAAVSSRRTGTSTPQPSCRSRRQMPGRSFRCPTASLSRRRARGGGARLDSPSWTWCSPFSIRTADASP